MHLSNDTILERLAALRSRVAGCRVVSFVDLSTRMSLAASTKGAFPQEKLDQLCRQATTALTVPDVFVALAWRSDEMFVFVRSSAAVEEALCIVSAPVVDTEATIKAAQAFLWDVSGGKETDAQ